MNLREEVAKSLLLMGTTLKFAKEITPELTSLWTALFQRAGIDPVDVEPVVSEYMTRSRDFPAPADIIEPCLARKHDREFQARCEQLTLANPTTPALPGPPPSLDQRLAILADKPLEVKLMMARLTGDTEMLEHLQKEPPLEVREGGDASA